MAAHAPLGAAAAQHFQGMNMNSSLTQLDQIKGTLIDLAIRFGP
jgi:hypothetical protein